MISVDMLVMSVVKRCFRLGLNYFIPLKNLKTTVLIIRETKSQYVLFKVYETFAKEISC